MQFQTDFLVRIILILIRRAAHILFILYICFPNFLASIDIEEIINGDIADSKVLQNVLPGIAFCNLDDEFNEQNWVSGNDINGSLCPKDVQQLPPGFAKLFRLTQLIIQYLLHSQKKLTDAIKILQNNNCGLQKVFFTIKSFCFASKIT